MRPSVLATVALLALLAGCQHRGGEPAPPDPFDGQAAWDFAAGLLGAEANTTWFRIPGTEDHQAAAAWLEQQLQVDGWSVARQEFSYGEFLAIPDPDAGHYREGCPPEDVERLQQARMVNLLALRGQGDGPLVILSAHWDSKQEATAGPVAQRGPPVPGANDGASGVGVLLQLQRELGSRPLPYRIGIALMDAEDGFEDCHPLAGSTVYADAMPQGRPDLFLLLDMVGDPQARFMRDARSQQSAPAVVDAFWTRAHAHGLGPNFVNQTRSILDDHVPLARAGVPAVDIIDQGRPGTVFPPYWHTTQDTMDKLDPAMLGRIGDLLVDLLDEPGLVVPGSTAPPPATPVPDEE